MIGNTIYFKDHNLKDCKGRILDKVLMPDEYFKRKGDKICLDKSELVTVTKYLVITTNSMIVLVEPNQIKKVL